MQRAVGLPPEGRAESCRTANGAASGLTFAVYGGSPWPLITPPDGRARLSRFMSRPSGVARRRCALEVSVESCNRMATGRGHRYLT